MIRYAILIICFLLPPSYAESLKESREDAFFTQAGDVMQIALPLSAAGYSLAIWDTEGLKQYTYSFGATMLAAYALKYSVGRPRPYQNPDERGHSFPSGSHVLLKRRRAFSKASSSLTTMPFILLTCLPGP